MMVTTTVYDYHNGIPPLDDDPSRIIATKHLVHLAGYMNVVVPSQDAFERCKFNILVGDNIAHATHGMRRDFPSPWHLKFLARMPRASRDAR